MIEIVPGVDDRHGRVAKRTAAHPPDSRPDEILVGGTNSAFPLPLEGCIERGAGSRVWDERGHEYIDFLLASGPLILGHAHARVCDAVARQLSKGSAFHAVNRPALELAARIADIPGCVEMVRFASTGTEATLHAVRLARGYTGRDKVLVFAGSYHGSHDLALIGHRGPTMARGGGVPHGGSLAAVLVEPQHRSVDPLPAFLPRLAQLCRSAGTVLIFDEVVTGFRLAFGGAQEYYSVEPDLVCYGKILGGGFPLSAVGGRRDIMTLADPALSSSPNFVHISGTLSGNPISAVAGLATLAELERPGVYERLHGLGERLRDGLAREMHAHDVGGSVIGSGPIAAVKFSETRRPRCDAPLRETVNRELIGRGVLVQLQTKFYVSLVHTEREIDYAVDTFGAALGAATEGESDCNKGRTFVPGL